MDTSQRTKETNILLSGTKRNYLKEFNKSAESDGIEIKVHIFKGKNGRRWQVYYASINENFWNVNWKQLTNLPLTNHAIQGGIKSGNQLLFIDPESGTFGEILKTKSAFDDTFWISCYQDNVYYHNFTGSDDDPAVNINELKILAQLGNFNKVLWKTINYHNLLPIVGIQLDDEIYNFFYHFPTVNKFAKFWKIFKSDIKSLKDLNLY